MGFYMWALSEAWIQSAFVFPSDSCLGENPSMVLSTKLLGVLGPTGKVNLRHMSRMF